ncbi:phosphoribosyltransferase [Actinophytocola oryzae]|uniref:Putative phosphoribosyl transferase n=1 Tax=Actinophytocola oryzae TaxID=502181 RepID=A0A4R7UNT1_9PSEU|nr:phosphoribosyltransferase family protein [Actinophytocola oryzae]TDV34893.1 putative phosphoribosyl transferase [Actinophytocola oryzae]
MRFRDRTDAGRVLATHLAHLRGADPVVVGLPRGGVPVAAEIADALETDLDVVLVRKVGAPHREELAVGAVGEDGVTVRNDALLRDLGLDWADLAEQVARERAEIRRRAGILRPGPRPDLADRTVVLVDDGIATGASVIAALKVLRHLGAGRVVLAVPVAPPDSLRTLAPLADEIVCPVRPGDFASVGEWYDDFTQVPEEQVRKLLECLR